jgi:DNA-directed RNA polymerase subunit RPC12/RpoP
VKFSCERCGKKYATSDTPQPGRVYKLKCKACGHLIVVKGAIAGATTAPPAVAAGVPAGAPEAPLRSAAEPTTEVSSPFGSAWPAPEDELAPPPGDGGYVDLFADPSGARPVTNPGAPADPYLAASRDSLPDGFAGEGADPFAPIRAELEGSASAEAPEPAEESSRRLPAPKIPDIPRAPEQRHGFPVALVAGGVVVMLAVLAFVLVRFGRGEPAAPTPPAAVRATAASRPPLAPVELAPAPAQPPAHRPPRR